MSAPVPGPTHAGRLARIWQWLVRWADAMEASESDQLDRRIRHLEAIVFDLRRQAAASGDAFTQPDQPPQPRVPPIAPS